ncbi:MAG TPA: hypothetical protein PLB41_00940 [Rubrivivax sp.]|nr:hypothetical protein [Rubrivivax sp.]HPO17887.1 hypothetical protein [Rubrivivax sp.]
MTRDEPVPAAAGATAWRLEAASEPEHTRWHEVALTQMLDGSAAGPGMVFLPSGVATPYALQQQADAWTLAGPRGALRLDLLVRGDRIIWTPQRVVVLGAAERLPDVAAAVARFSWIEGELRAIEQIAHVNLQAAEQDVVLTHAVKTADLGQQRRVGLLTQSAHSSRIRLTRLGALLALPGDTLSGASQRLLSEMTLQAGFAERLRTLDDQIEVAQEIYDTVNDRLTDFSHFLREFRIEILIVVVLAVELALVIRDML